MAAAWAQRTRRVLGRLRDVAFRLGWEAGCRPAAADRTPVRAPQLVRLLGPTLQRYIVGKL